MSKIRLLLVQKNKLEDIKTIQKTGKNGVPSGIRTRVAAVKGRCPRPLDDGDLNDYFQEAQDKDRLLWS
jgi:hypothetical protein